MTGLIVALIVSISAYSEEGNNEIDLQLGGKSIHATQRKDGKQWNQSNGGVAVQYVTPEKLWGKDVEICITAGQIKNSEFGESAFVGSCVRKNVLKGAFGQIAFGTFVGAMNYTSKYNSRRKTTDLFPVLLPTASACLAIGACVDATYIPKVQKSQGSSAILLMLRFPILKW